MIEHYIGEIQKVGRDFVKESSCGGGCALGGCAIRHWRRSYFTINMLFKDIAFQIVVQKVWSPIWFNILTVDAECNKFNLHFSNTPLGGVVLFRIISLVFEYFISMIRTKWIEKCIVAEIGTREPGYLLVIRATIIPGYLLVIGGLPLMFESLSWGSVILVEHQAAKCYLPAICCEGDFHSKNQSHGDSANLFWLKMAQYWGKWWIQKPMKEI